jgi:beta-barrel assembly-enhancing protease
MVRKVRRFYRGVAVAGAAVAALGVASPFACAQANGGEKPKPAPKQEKPKPPAEDPEVKLGRETHEDLLRSGLRLVTDAAIVNRVTTIGKKIADVVNAKKLEMKALYGSSEIVVYDYKFFVVDDPDINAFSLPGGFIYINKGLINYCQSDDELAGVLGHEIIHAAHHHVMKLQREQNKLNNQLIAGALISLVARVPAVDMMNLLSGFQLIALQKVNGFGQTAERDADYNGLRVSKEAGYNPVGMLTFMERLARDQQLRPEVELGIFRTHPPEKDRVSALLTQIKEMNVPINRRAVTNILKVEVREVAVGGAKASEVLLDKQILYRTPDAERAKDAAGKLDAALNKGAQVYDVTRRGNSVLVMGEPIFTITEQDAALPLSPKPEVLVDTGYKNLRLAIYRQNIQGGY